MLKNHKVLTSRLAVIIYRTATLQVDASVTKIGRYIHEKTGTKSKSFNFSMMKSLFNGAKIDISRDLLYKKNFKAYNLNINEAETIIRIEIARSLLSYNIPSITTKMVANITNLPVSTIERIDVIP